MFFEELFHDKLSLGRRVSTVTSSSSPSELELMISSLSTSFFFLFPFLFIFIFIIGGEPFTNIGTPSVLEILLLAEGCLTLILAFLLMLLGLGALGRNVALLTT